MEGQPGEPPAAAAAAARAEVPGDQARPAQPRALRARGRGGGEVAGRALKLRSGLVAMLRFLPRLPVRERSVGPPMGDSRGSLGHRFYERELLFVDAHAKPRPIVWPHFAVPALEEFGHVWHRALAMVVLHEDLTG